MLWVTAICTAVGSYVITRKVLIPVIVHVATKGGEIVTNVVEKTKNKMSNK